MPSSAPYLNFDLLITRAGDRYRALVVDAHGVVERAHPMHTKSLSHLSTLPSPCPDGIRRLWQMVLPFPYRTCLVLPVPFETAHRGLAAHINGDWSLDGGLRWTYGRPRIRYQDLHQYVGVVDGNFFHLAGPVGMETLPMVIEGELWPHGNYSVLTLVARASWSNMLRSLLGILVLGVVLYGVARRFFPTSEVNGIAQLVFWPATVFVLYFMSMMIWQIHRQMRLLLKQLVMYATPSR